MFGMSEFQLQQYINQLHAQIDLLMLKAVDNPEELQAFAKEYFANKALRDPMQAMCDTNRNLDLSETCLNIENAQNNAMADSK